MLQLTQQLTRGLSRVPEGVWERHVAYVRAAQNADGGFSGREGGSDLYYTAFALRGLAVLGGLTPEVCARAAGYLSTCLSQKASVVDFFSLLYAAALLQMGGGPDPFAGSLAGWDQRVADVLESFRTPDGGYGKATDSATGSTYHTFLVSLCYQLLGRELPRPEEAVRFIHARRREDGGFVEIAAMKRSGTNPTAAAVGVLQLAQDGAALCGELRDAVVRFLSEMPSIEGGFRANARAPLADLLSTFTGLWTLHRLGALASVNTTAIQPYVQQLQQEAGGFRGGIWDQQTDVEYTFYGLGCLAVLALGMTA
jgi:geranylgeranyl transferase type-2 subunit beta